MYICITLCICRLHTSNITVNIGRLHEGKNPCDGNPIDDDKENQQPGERERREKSNIYIYDRKGKLYHIYMTGKEKELSYI